MKINNLLKFLLGFIVVALISCNKDKIALEKIAGKWRIYKVVYDDEGIIPEVYIRAMHFEAYAENDTCQYVFSMSQDGGQTFTDSDPTLYTMSSDGKKIFIKHYYIYSEYNIHRLTKTEMVLYFQGGNMTLKRY